MVAKTLPMIMTMECGDDSTRYFSQRAAHEITHFTHFLSVSVQIWQNKKGGGKSFFLHLHNYTFKRISSTLSKIYHKQHKPGMPHLNESYFYQTTRALAICCCCLVSYYSPFLPGVLCWVWFFFSQKPAFHVGDMSHTLRRCNHSHRGLGLGERLHVMPEVTVLKVYDHSQ